MAKLECVLKDWDIDRRIDCYTLHGIVVSHPRLSAGEFVRTSRLERIDFDTMLAETKNTIYRLV